MTPETLRLVRNILLRTFVIGLAIVLLLGGVTIAAWDSWTGLAGRLFHTDTATLTPIVLKFFVDIRSFLLFILLAPALAIHWTLRKDLGKNRKN